MAPEARQDLAIPLRVELERPDGSRSVEYAVNVSAGGLCLHLQEPLQVGEEVGIDFSLPPSGPRVVTRAKVLWTTWSEEEGSEEAPGARFCETGLQFDGLEDSLQQQVERFASQPRNRRR